MKRGFSLAIATVFGFVLVAGAGAAFASLADPIKVNVPFDFVVGTKTLPAGEYLISTPDENVAGLLAIRSENGKSAIFVQANPLSPKGAIWVANTRLTFEKVGGKEFLTRVWESGSDIGYSLPASPLETKAEKAGGK
jgi:hypothetical protein